MKKFLFAILMIAFAFPCFASQNGGQAFGIYSAASAAVKTSAAVNVRGFKSKTMTVSGVTLTSNATSATFKTMSGTAIVQCAPSSNGPWSTCINNNYAQTAASLTANNTFSWEDAVAYIRVKWTASTTGQKVKIFLNWLEN